MSYQGRRDQRGGPPYGQRRETSGGEKGRPSGFERPPPASTTGPDPANHATPMGAGYRTSMALPAVYPAPAPSAPHVVCSPPAVLQVPGPSPSRALVTHRLRNAPASASSAPSAVALSNEVNKNLFIFEVALPRTSAVAAEAVVTTPEGKTVAVEGRDDHNIDLVPKMGLARFAPPNPNVSLREAPSRIGTVVAEMLHRLFVCARV